jgi:hypothetical protein
MDEELKTYLVAMEARLMTSINDNVERVLDQMTAVRSDVHSIGGHLLNAMEESLTLSRRVTKLEDDMRQLRRGKGI